MDDEQRSVSRLPLPLPRRLISAHRQVQHPGRSQRPCYALLIPFYASIQTVFYPISIRSQFAPHPPLKSFAQLPRCCPRGFLPYRDLHTALKSSQAQCRADANTTPRPVDLCTSEFRTLVVLVVIRTHFEYHSRIRGSNDFRLLRSWVYRNSSTDSLLTLDRYLSFVFIDVGRNEPSLSDVDGSQRPTTTWLKRPTPGRLSPCSCYPLSPTWALAVRWIFSRYSLQRLTSKSFADSPSFQVLTSLQFAHTNRWGLSNERLYARRSGRCSTSLTIHTTSGQLGSGMPLCEQVRDVSRLKSLNPQVVNTSRAHTLVIKATRNSCTPCMISPYCKFNSSRLFVSRTELCSMQERTSTSWLPTFSLQVCYDTVPKWDTTYGMKGTPSATSSCHGSDVTFIHLSS